MKYDIKRDRTNCGFDWIDELVSFGIMAVAVAVCVAFAVAVSKGRAAREKEYQARLFDARNGITTEAR